MNPRVAAAVVRNYGIDFLPQSGSPSAWALLWIVLAVLFTLPAHALGTDAPEGKNQAAPAPANHASVAVNYGKLPLRFEANRGQADPRAKFLARGGGYSLFLTDSSAVLSLSKRNLAKARLHNAGAPDPSLSYQTDVIRMDLPGAGHDLRVAGSDQLSGTVNYFIGNDPAKWHSAIPTFGKVRYSEVYPGVDLVYYGNQRQLEYDFVVAPSADIRPIRLHFDGAKTLKLDAGGNLRVIARNGEVAFHKPLVYQETPGKRRSVQGRFVLLGDNTAGFAIGAYDSTRALVIDPVLVYSTYLGGTFEDEANAIAVDGSGDAYVAGLTVSSDFPTTTGAFQTVNNKASTNYTAFVSEVNPAGTALVYSTYLGGSTQDIAYAVAVDGSGDAYVGGYTASADYPVTAGAYQTTNNTDGSSTGFVTKLNATGTALVYSTYLGGSGAEGVNAIAVNGSLDAYVTGFTGSIDFPVTGGAFQSTNHAAEGTAFVTELNAAGSGLVYSTYLGGTFGEQAYAIALDGSLNAYVAGWTGSIDFPVSTGAYQATNKDPGVSVTKLLGNAFVTKMNSTGTGLIYSTYLGGSTGGGAARVSSVQDQASGIAVDGSGNAYVTGFAFSTDFPVTTGAFQTANNAGATGNSNAFVTKLNATGTGLLYSTYLGGSEGNPATGITNEGGYAIAVDGSEDAIVAGTTSSDTFPVTPGTFQPTNRAGFDAGYVTRLNATGTGLLYSTYLSGSTLDGARALALDGMGNVYLAGLSDSVDFPISAGAFQTKDKTTAFGTCFVAKMDLGFAVTATTTTLISVANPQGAGLPLTLTATVAPTSGGVVPTGGAIFSVDGARGTYVPLTNGAVTVNADYFIPGTFSVGTHTIVATYSPDAAGSIYGSSSGTLTQTITTSSPIGTTTTLTSSANPQTAGLPITFTATVKPASGTSTPTGTVTTTVDGATGPTLFLINGVGSITTSLLAAGTHTIVATYVADTNSADYTTSSATLVQTVNGAAAPAVSLSSTSLSFGGVNIGATSASQSVTMTNTGSAALSISSITVTGTNASSFGFANSCGSTLAAGANCSIHGHFAPLSAGALTAAVSIVDNASNSPQSIALSGTGVGAPAVSLSSASLSFGSEAVGGTTASQTVTLTNTGNAALAISSITVTGANASSFAFANSCGASLAAGANCTIHGHFTPLSAGALTAAITITDNAGNSPQSIALSGTGTGSPAVSLSATSLSFGSENVGVTSASQSVTLTNTGNAPLTIGSIAVSGTNASSFVFANSCGASVAAGANCSIHGHFTPATAGALTAAITITDNAGNSPQSIALSGTGTGSPAVSLSATSLSFGSENVGVTSASQSVTLTNTGNAPLTITSIAVTGTNASSFVFSNSCGSSVAAGANCSIHGHFTPLAAGALTAAVTIVDNAGNSPQSIALSGTGTGTPAVSLSATSLSFGTQAVGTSSASQTVTLTNTGNAPLTIGSITVTGTDASSFAFGTSCGASVAAGANCTIHGHFTPAAAGALTAAVTIVDNAGNSPQSIALSGTGQ